jgi:phosphoglycerate dehydrogenase-like enzyme
MAHPSRIIALNLKLAAPVLDRIRALAPEHQVVQVAELRQNWSILARAEILLSHTFPQEQLQDNTQLRWIQTAGAGVEWLLTPEIRGRRELVITNASGIHAQPIAEHSFGFMLMFARQLHLARSHQARAEWAPAKQEALSSLAGKTLGILGVGAIGQRIAQLGAAFGMRVIGLRRSAEPVAGVERIYPPEQLHALLSESDYILNALPLTAATRGLLDQAAFAAMRPHAFLVNIGRGQTIQREALLRALTERRIGGVGLDVTDPEPLPSDDPLWRFDNAIITAHYAGGQPDYVARVAEIFLDNLERYLAGRPLVNVVDKDAGY